MQILGPTPESETLEMRPSNLWFNKTCKWSVLAYAYVWELLIWFKPCCTGKATENMRSKAICVTWPWLASQPAPEPGPTDAWCGYLPLELDFLPFSATATWEAQVGPNRHSFCLHPPILHQGRYASPKHLGSFVSFWTVAGVCCLEAA